MSSDSHVVLEQLKNYLKNQQASLLSELTGIDNDERSTQILRGQILAITETKTELDEIISKIREQREIDFD
jgi:hypothetical protein